MLERRHWAEDGLGGVAGGKTMSISNADTPIYRPNPWNKGRLVGQKRPLAPKHVWSIRIRLEMADDRRGLALFNLAIDSKLRACDLVALKVNDVFVGGQPRQCAIVVQQRLAG